MKMLELERALKEERDKERKKEEVSKKPIKIYAETK